MAKRSNRRSRISYLSAQEERRADESAARCERPFKIAANNLAILESQKLGRNSKRWSGQFLKEIYLIVQHLLNERDPEALKQDFYLLIAKDSNNPEARNLFNLAIQAFETEYDFGIGKQRRSEYANALAYAWAQSIPAQLVHGFILQVGGVKSAAKKFMDGDKEEWAAPSLPWDTLTAIDQSSTQ